LNATVQYQIELTRMLVWNQTLPKRMTVAASWRAGADNSFGLSDTTVNKIDLLSVFCGLQSRSSLRHGGVYGVISNSR
jgi:hypothetical protein